MYRILVADDEPIERQVVSKRIQKNFPGQIEIFTAQNGREAMEIFERENCQIAILDISMPGINGLEAAKYIREKYPDSIIIFLTAYDEFNYAKQAIGVKALEYLLKPGRDEELQATLEEAFSLIDCNRTPTVEEAPENSAQTAAADEDLDHARINVIASEIASFLESHYQDDLSLQSVAGRMGYSEVYFCRLFKNCFDKTFIMYLNDLRMAKAVELLKDISINIKEISGRVGYRDANYFTRIFKKKMGMTPSEFRNKKEMP